MRRAILLAGAVALFVQGCSNLGYYAQSVSGQVDMWSRCRPIHQVLADPQTAPKLKDRLTTVVSLREFATRELHLPDNGSYREYADLGRPYVLWNVFAAPEFSTELRTWCFPLIGCVGYRGYFSRENAESFAADLRSQGLDVHVGEVPAYSTLGWFDDPVLNTFVFSSDLQLANHLFHELSHQLLYVKNDTEFNESFATFLGREGAQRWSGAAGSGRGADLEAADKRRKDFNQLVLGCRGKLDALYASEASDGAKREGKARILKELRADYELVKRSWGGYDGYDDWFDKDVNNARLGSIATYTRLVPGFEALLAEEKGDMDRFYGRARELAKLPVPERRALLEGLAGKRMYAAASSSP